MHPVTFKIHYPENLSRGQLLLKTFFGFLYVGIPHGICLFFLGIVASVFAFIAFWAILFTGTYPRGMFDFIVGVQRWSYRVSAYLGLMTDVYPPFTMQVTDSDAVVFDVQYPESLGRGKVLLKLFFGFFYVIIPHGFCLAFIGIGASFCIFIAFWAILFTGRFPEGMFRFIEGYYRWGARMSAYIGYLMTDVYPPFTGQEV